MKIPVKEVNLDCRIEPNYLRELEKCIDEIENLPIEPEVPGTVRDKLHREVWVKGNTEDLRVSYFFNTMWPRQNPKEMNWARGNLYIHKLEDPKRGCLGYKGLINEQGDFIVRPTLELTPYKGS